MMPITPSLIVAIDRLWQTWRYTSYTQEDERRFSCYVWDKYGFSPTTISFYAVSPRQSAFIEHQHEIVFENTKG